MAAHELEKDTGDTIDYLACPRAMGGISHEARFLQRSSRELAGADLGEMAKWHFPYNPLHRPSFHLNKPLRTQHE
jgi:hypothetical protein